MALSASPAGEAASISSRLFMPASTRYGPLKVRTAPSGVLLRRRTWPRDRSGAPAKSKRTLSSRCRPRLGRAPMRASASRAASAEGTLSLISVSIGPDNGRSGHFDLHLDPVFRVVLSVPRGAHDLV